MMAAHDSCEKKVVEPNELLKRCREGNELAWESLVRQYQSRIYGIAYAYVGNAEDARDMAQDIFVQIYRKLDTCREPDRFLPWIIRIAQNASVDFLRRRKARPQREDLPVDEMRHLKSPGPDPEEHYAMESRKRLVYRAMQTLSDISREIILLRDMQGLALAEIAEMLSVPLGTIKSRSNRARIELARAVRALIGEPNTEVS